MWEPGMTMRDVTVLAIREALLAHHGNKTRAAQELDIAVRTLRLWVRRDPRLAEFRCRVGSGRPYDTSPRYQEPAEEYVSVGMPDAQSCHERPGEGQSAEDSPA